MDFITITDPTNGMTAYTLDFNADIERGIEFLDSQVGKEEWLLKINPALLNVSDVTYCVCGQVFEGHYFEGVKRIAESLGKTEDEMYDKIIAGYGFSINMECDDWELFRERFVTDHLTEKGLNHGYERDTYSDAHADAVDAAAKWAWSCLTEQWLTHARKLIADRGLAIRLADKWEKVGGL